RLRIEEPGRQVLTLVERAQRRRLKRDRVMVEPPTHPQISTEPEIHARVLAGIECDVRERIAVAVDHADRMDGDAAVEHVAVERPEQRRRDRAIETSVVEEDLENAWHDRSRNIPRTTGCAPLVEAAMPPGVATAVGNRRGCRTSMLRLRNGADVS